MILEVEEINEEVAPAERKLNAEHFKTKYWELTVKVVRQRDQSRMGNVWHPYFNEHWNAAEVGAALTLGAKRALRVDGNGGNGNKDEEYKQEDQNTLDMGQDAGIQPKMGGKGFQQ